MLSNEEIGSLRENLAPFSFDKKISSLESKYSESFGLNFENADHLMGYLPLTGFKIATHLYKVSNPKGTIFLLHGLFDHFVYLKNIARHSIELGFNVVAFELPGHGLSSGERGEIDDFSTYSKVLTAGISFFSELKSPFHFIGHSTGCTAFLAEAPLPRLDGIDQVILLAPLIRPFMFYKAKFSLPLARLFKYEVKRVFKKNSKDLSFLEFVKKDPICNLVVKLSWLDAMMKWNSRFEKIQKIERPITVIQGTLDTTVDGKFNMKSISKKFSNSDIHIIEEAGHQLPNEIGYLLKQVLKIITKKIT